MKKIKEHKLAISIFVVCVILFILAFIAIYSMFNPSNSKSVYGSRLDGEVNIETNTIDEIKSKISASNLVSEVTYNKNVRILKFIITTSSTDEAGLQKLSSVITDNLSKEAKDYYDIEIYVNGDSSFLPMIGYKSKSANNFTWTVNRGEDSE